MTRCIASRVNSLESRTEEILGAKVGRVNDFFVVVASRAYRCVKPTSSWHNEGLTTGIHDARPFAHVTCKNHPLDVGRSTKGLRPKDDWPVIGSKGGGKGQEERGGNPPSLSILCSLSSREPNSLRRANSTNKTDVYVRFA